MKLLTFIRCWLRDHETRQVVLYLPGRVVTIQTCRCGRRTDLAGRSGQYPMPRAGRA